MKLKKALTVTLSGELPSKALLLLTSIYLARALGPSDFGVLSTALAIFGFFQIFSESGSNVIGVRLSAKSTNDDKEAIEVANALRLSRLICTLFLIGIGLIIYLVMQDTLSLMMLVLVLSLVFHSMNLDWFARGTKNFSISSVSNLAGALTYFLGSAVLLAKIGVWGAITSKAASLLLASIAASALLRTKYATINLFPVMGQDSLQRINSIIREGIIVSIGVSLSRIYFNSDIILLNFMKDSATAGVYASIGIIYSTVIILRGIIGSVLLPYFCAAADQEYRKLFLKVSVHGVLSGIMIIVAIAMGGEFLLKTIYGTAYLTEDLNNTLTIFSIALFVVCAGTAASLSLHSLGKTREYMVCTASAAILNVAGNLILIPEYGMLAAAFTTLLAETIAISLCFYFAKNRNHVKH